METILITAVAGAAVLLLLYLLLFSRRRERVIDAATPPPGRGDSAVASPPSASATDRALTAGEVLETRGESDAVCGLADWLMQDAERTVGAGLGADSTAVTRIADAAVKASPELRSTGRATIDLPFLAADAAGPRHYKREVTRAEVELPMIELSALMAYELLEWRGRDDRAVAFAEWLEDEAGEAGGDNSVDSASTLRLADATDKALADVAASGSATIDLPDLKTVKGVVFHFRRTLTREELGDILDG